jgi:hypothetical protein
VVLEGHARLEGCQHADEALLDGVSGEELPGEILLVDLGRLEIAGGPLELASFGERRLLETVGGDDGRVLEVEQPDLRRGEEELHATVSHERQEVATEDETVESGHYPGDKREKASYELLHGVLLG